MTLNRQGIRETDWAPLLPFLMNEKHPLAERAGGFHASLARAIVAQANAAREEHGELTVGLSGGVFQNRVLTEHTLTLLRASGFDVRLTHEIPCNDAGISFGQIIEFRMKPA
jgi:hydrogenase maturation protein HypF